MKSPIYLAVIVAALPLSGCNFMPTKPTLNGGTTSEKFLGYQPVDPAPAKSVTYFDPCTHKEKTVPWATLVYARNVKGEIVSCQTSAGEKYAVTIQDLLPLQSARVSVRQDDGSGKLTYLSSSISGSVGTYDVVMDFMKYRIRQVYDEGGHYIGDALIGVGLRIRASVVTNKANLNLSSLMGIGVEASRGNLTGTISVDVIGIDSPDVTNLIPLSSEINQTSIQAALQGLAAIKAKLWQNDTHLFPHVLGMRQLEPGKVAAILRDVAVYQWTSSSDLLRRYWKPDGTHVDADHERRLNNWMRQHGVPAAHGDIVMFLSSPKYKSLRDRAANELINTCNNR